MPDRAIEIHDSTLDSISVLNGCAVLYFSAVYIHQSAGRPGIHAGSGWVQEARLRIRDAVVTGSATRLPCDLLDGHIQLGGSLLSNEIPIPLSHVGEVEVRLESRDEVFLITGGSAELELIGEPKYVEEFRPSRDN